MLHTILILAKCILVNISYSGTKLIALDPALALWAVIPEATQELFYKELITFLLAAP